jgi:hemerythrin
MLWSESLATGIKLIDDQHKELFRQVDNLLDPKDENRYKEILDFLENYIVKHFSDEMKMQEQSKYPKAAVHKKYHDEYVKAFRELRAKYLAHGPSVSNNIAINKSVVGWLKDHIFVHDKEFAAYYKSLKK